MEGFPGISLGTTPRGLFSFIRILKGVGKRIPFPIPSLSRYLLPELTRLFYRLEGGLNPLLPSVHKGTLSPEVYSLRRPTTETPVSSPIRVPLESPKDFTHHPCPLTGSPDFGYTVMVSSTTVSGSGTTSLWYIKTLKVCQGISFLFTEV